MRAFLFLIFLFLLPQCLAFDCDFFSGSTIQDCQELKSVDEDLIAGLIYTSTLYPDHEFILNYNSGINIDSAPAGTSYHSRGSIQNAWLKIITIMPSVKYNSSLLVPGDIQVRNEFDYSIRVPDNYYSSHESDGSTCKIRYSLYRNEKSLKVYASHQLKGTGKISQFSIREDAQISSELRIKATIKARKYRWDRYCCRYREGHCRRYCYDCDYYDTDYDTDILVITDTRRVQLYEQEPKADLQFISSYYGTNKAQITKNADTSLILDFNNSYFKEHEFEYSAEFTNKPFYTLQLAAERQQHMEQENLIRDNYTLYVKDASNCQIKYFDFFSEDNKQCDYELSGEDIKEIKRSEMTTSLRLFFTLLVFLFVMYLLYMGIKKTWGKALIPITMMLFFIPFVSAEECGLTNLASCIPEKMYDFFIDLINAPLQPLLSLTRTLLESPPKIELFEGIWAIIVYCISMFYGLLFIYSGFQFIFSGHNVIRREMAKDWLKNTVMMIVLIQASFYLYSLILDMGSIMTTAVLSMVDEHFFMITADNLVNIGLEFLFLTFYVLTLFLTIIFLVIRYLVVAFGVIFVPLGIFCYFIPPLKSYGKMTLHILGIFIFITFLDAIVILACSMLIEIDIFENIKIVVMICCFSIINLLFIMLTKHVISKSSVSDSGEKVAQAVKYIAMFA